MLSSRIFASLSVAAVVASGVAFAAPASAELPPLTITKERTGANPIVAGSSSGTQFTITVTNNYGEPLAAAVQDQAPPGLTLTGATSGTWTDCQVDPTYVNCASVILNPGQTATLVVTATADAWVRPSTLVNCAHAGQVFTAPEVGSRVDPATPIGCALGAPEAGVSNGYYGSAEAPVDVVNDADMELTASHAAQYDQVDPGNEAVVDFAVKNNGPSGASGPIEVKGTLPKGTSFLSGAGAGWTCSSVDQDVTCTFTPTPPDAPAPAFLSEPSMPPGASASTLSWTLGTAKPGTVASYPVTATVSSATEDSQPANNTSSTPIGVTPVDLALTKSATGAVTVGDDMVWNLAVSNVGTIDDAATATLVDTLPAGSTFVSGAGEGWTCAASGQKVTCTRAGMAKGLTTSLLITARVKSGAPGVTNEAEVSTQSYESNTANNSASAEVRVRRMEQTAKALPASPSHVKSGRTDQGKKLTTRVLCRPVTAGALGEVAYCKVTRKGDVVKVKVLGSRKVKVTVIQTAKGSAKYKPFVQRRSYIVKP
jgi:uncharacterized repeat protein (TIGR01451 family)